MGGAGSMGSGAGTRTWKWHAGVFGRLGSGGKSEGELPEKRGHLHWEYLFVLIETSAEYLDSNERQLMRCRAPLCPSTLTVLLARI